MFISRRIGLAPFVERLMWARARPNASGGVGRRHSSGKEPFGMRGVRGYGWDGMISLEPRR